MSKRELPTPGGSPFLFALCLPLRSPRSGFVPLRGFLMNMGELEALKGMDKLEALALAFEYGRAKGARYAEKK